METTLLPERIRINLKISLICNYLVEKTRLIISKKVNFFP